MSCSLDFSPLIYKFSKKNIFIFFLPLVPVIFVLGQKKIWNEKKIVFSVAKFAEHVLILDFAPQRASNNSVTQVSK